MDVSVIENWTDIHGSIQRWQAESDIPGHGILEVYVEEAFEVEGFPNLLGQTPGSLLNVYVSAATVEGQAIRPARKIACRVRLGGPNKVFCHPDNFRIANT